MCRGLPVQRVGETELGNDLQLILGLSGEPGRLLKLKQRDSYGSGSRNDDCEVVPGKPITKIGKI